MAITFANLGTSGVPDFASTTDANSYATSSWSPPTSELICLYVLVKRVGGSASVPTVSGNGLSWNFIIDEAIFPVSDQWRVVLFGANASGATTGATTVDLGGVTHQGCSASFFQAIGVDLSGGVGPAFVQKPTNKAGSGATSGTVTLSAASSSDNRTIAGFFHTTSEGTTPNSNFTELDDLTNADAGGFMSEYRADVFDASPSGSWSTSSGWIGIAAELKALGGAPGGGVTLDPFGMSGFFGG